MNSDNIAREVSRITNGLEELVRALVTELTMHEQLIERLQEKLLHLHQVQDRQGEKIEELSQKGSQPVSIKIDGDIGERLDALEGRVEELEGREESHTEDDIRQWAREEADEALSNASFTVTVD